MSGAVDRGRPPAPGAPQALRIPERRESRLTGGLRVVVLERPEVPLVHLEWVLPAGADEDPPERAGRATLSAALLDEGTGSRSGPQIAREVEELGGHLTTTADWDGTYLGLGALAAHLEPALEILGDVAVSPTFPDDEVERHRTRRLRHLRQRHDDPGVLATDHLLDLLYAGTAYARPRVGTIEGVSALTREEIVDWQHRRLDPANGVLIAVGAVEASRIETLLGPGPEGRVPPVEPPRPTLQGAGIRIRLIDRPGAPQTELRLGHPGPPRSDPDWPTLKLLNAVLGGKFSSRLNLTLRERHGWTYGAHSAFVGRRGPGPFLISTALETAATGRAVEAVRRELQRLREERGEEQEIEESRQYLLGTYPQSFQTLDSLAGRIATETVLGLRPDHFELEMDAIRTVDAADVQRAARRHLQPEALAIVAVGPAEELRRQLETFAEPELVSSA